MSRRPAPRISAREAWTEIAMAADPALAARLRQRRDEPDLDDEETSRMPRRSRALRDREHGALPRAAAERPSEAEGGPWQARSARARRPPQSPARPPRPRPRAAPGGHGAPRRPRRGAARPRAQPRPARRVVGRRWPHAADPGAAARALDQRAGPRPGRRGEGQYGERVANRPRAAATAVGVSP